MMPDKEKIHAHCVELLNTKILLLKRSLSELEEGSESDSKSSAGDKHETARAMMQIEQEKLGKQLNELVEQKSVLDKINVTSTQNKITSGSLVETNRGLLFVSVPLGKISIENSPVIVLSAQSPLGNKLLGLSAGNTAEINGIKYSIENVY